MKINTEQILGSLRNPAFTHIWQTTFDLGMYDSVAEPEI